MPYAQSTLLFDQTKSPPTAIKIPVSTWATYFGFNTNVVITSTPTVSTQLPVVINSMKLKYTFQDNVSSTSFVSNVTFVDNEFTNASNNINSDFGLNVLHQSIIFDNFDLFKKLLQKNIDINMADFYGNTPLHYILTDKKKLN